MKEILTVTIIVLLGSVLGPCSPVDKESSLPTDSNSSAQPTKHQTSDGLPTIPYDEMSRQVAGLSKQAGIVNLKATNLSDGQTEIRIWKGFGLTYPRCFILAITNGIAAPSYRAPKMTGTKAVFRNGNPVYANRPLNAPHSGWDNLLTYLKEHGIGSSIDLELDERYMPDPDGEELVLEMKNGSRHTMAYYAASTATVDGKKAFAICQKLENEFKIHLGCR